MIELYALLIFIIIAAIIAVEIKDLLSSIIAVGAVGLGICMIFLILKAPDVAITQLVVEILVLIVLIRATLRVDLPFSTTGRWYLNTLITITFLVSFLFIATIALKSLPKFGHPIMKIANYYSAQGLDKTGAANLVNAVLLDFRAYDTLGEVTILFAALIGVLAVARSVGRKKKNKFTENTDE